MSLKEINIIGAFEKLKPEACVFVLSVDKNDKPSGMVCGWWTKCSFEDELFAVCLGKKRYTLELIRQSGEFVVAAPNESLIKQVEFFGTTSGRNVDKFKESKLETTPATKTKTPLIKEATVNLECKVQNEFEVGDHVMVIGKVLAAHIDEEKNILFDTKKVDGKWVFKELLKGA